MEQTFEQVDKHVEQHFSSVPKSVSKSVSIDKLKQIYFVVRPILGLVSSLPLIPKKWRSAISTFITVLDGLTGGGE